jgi:ABC-2 type transport system permease protein
MARFISDTLLLLSLRRQVAWNEFRARSLGRRVFAVAAALGITLGAGIGSMSIGLGLGAILRRFPELALEALLPGAILTVVALLLVLVAFGAALGSLFLAGDLELLMAAPIDQRAIFVSKLLDGMGWYYAVVAIGAGPALVAYGVGLGYGPAYFVLALLALVGTPLLPTGLAALLVLVVVRFAPARRVREFLGLVAAVTGIGCSIAGQTGRIWMRQFFAFNGPLGTPGTQGAVGREQLEALLARVHEVAALPVPSFVAGRGLAAAGRGDIGAAMSDLGGFYALTFGFFAVCTVIAGVWYGSSWSRLQGSGSSRRGKARTVRTTQSAADWLGHAPAAVAVALKDWRIFPRDLTGYRQMLAPLIAIPAVYFNLFSRSGRRGQNAIDLAQRAAGLDLRGVATAAAVLLLCTMIFSRMAVTSVAREGKGWWTIKAAPITAWELLGGKLLVVAVPYVVVSTVMMVAVSIWNEFGLAGALYGWFGVQLLGIAMLALNVAVGVPLARLDWDDPRRMTSPWAALFTALGFIVIGLLGGVLLSLPVAIEAIVPGWTVLAWLFGPLSAAGVAVAAAWTAAAYAAQRLPFVGEA